MACEGYILASVFRWWFQRVVLPYSLLIKEIDCGVAMDMLVSENSQRG